MSAHRGDQFKEQITAYLADNPPLIIDRLGDDRSNESARMAAEIGHKPWPQNHVGTEETGYSEKQLASIRTLGRA